MSEGPFFPRPLPDAPQSWSDLLTTGNKLVDKLIDWTAKLIILAGLIYSITQGCQVKQTQVAHGEAIEANKEKIEKHAEKIDEIKAALPDKP